MGPRSDNRGYVARRPGRHRSKRWLQWVRGPITAVMSRQRLAAAGAGRASMGPRSDNRGYAEITFQTSTMTDMLQWVRGPITAVMAERRAHQLEEIALQWVRGPITAV